MPVQVKNTDPTSDAAWMYNDVTIYIANETAGHDKRKVLEDITLTIQARIQSLAAKTKAERAAGAGTVASGTWPAVSSCTPLAPALLTPRLGHHRQLTGDSDTVVCVHHRNTFNGAFAMVWLPQKRRSLQLAVLQACPSRCATP